MIGFAAPGFLIAGGLVALAAVALHLLVRSPPMRAPLPTARFLSPVRRAAVRFVRRPTDALLLAVRVLFALALGAAFAGPVWVARTAAAATVVLLDRGAGMAPVWAEAVDSARRIAGESERARVVVFDTSASSIDLGALDSVAREGTSRAESDYGAAFRALARSGGGTEVGRVVLVTLPRWSSWGDGTRAARNALRGMVEMVGDWGMGDGGLGMGVVAEPGTALRDALEAMGWTAVDPGAGAEGEFIRLRYAGVAAPTGWRLLDDSTAREGVPEVVFFGGWTVPVPRAGQLVPAGQATEHPDGADSVPVANSPARAIAAWRYGGIAAVAGWEGESCVVTTAFPVDTGSIVLEPTYPELVRHLASACLAGGASSGAPAAGRLDSGAIEVLVGSAEGTMESEVPTGRSLAWPLLFLALLLAVLEWPLRNRRRVQES